MKKRLTIRFLIFNFIILFGSLVGYIAINLITINSNFSFTNGFYNLQFRPGTFMEEVKGKIICEEDKFRFEGDTLKILKENHIWIQILDNSNKEIFNFNKPEAVKDTYTTAELMRFSMKPWEISNSTLYFSDLSIDNKEFTFVMAYPMDEINRRSFLFTKDSMLLFLVSFIIMIIFMLIGGYFFSKTISSPISKIVNKIKILAEGKYIKKSNYQRGIFKEVNNNIIILSNTLEDNRREATEILRKREEWISNISHDLKTPLASIKGYSQLIGYEENVDKEVKKYNDRILDKTNYMEGLIEDLSLVYKLKNMPIKKKRENIVQILREIIIDILNNPKYKDVNISINYDKEDVYIMCDKKYINRAFNNLIYNAILHNPKGTNIEVNIELKEEIIITIKDDGNGISDEDLKNLFDRYYRATNTGETHKGSGLGMAISKKIIEVHKGTITVESELNNGTTLTIKLNKILLKGM